MSAVPSPKLQRNVSVSPLSGSVEPDASRPTVSGAGPLAGVAVSAAVGARFVVPVYAMRLTSPPPA